MRNIMRTPILSALFGLLLVGCITGEISGGDDDDDGGPVCGNGVMEGTETCDDGNLNSGDGCSAACVGEIARVDLAVDMPAVTSELATETMLTITVSGADGFRGPVTLAATAVDAAQAPVPGWTIELSATTINVAYDSAAVPVVARVLIPSEGVAGAVSVKVTATSAAGAGNNTATTTFTVDNQVTFTVTMSGGQCVYPGTGGQANAVRVKEGTKLKFLNKGTGNLIIHSDGGQYGVPHGDVGTNIAVDAAYTGNNGNQITVTGADGQSFGWYCHAPGPNLGGNNPNILVVP